MKKFLSFLLTFVMLFSLTMPAMAAEVTGGTGKDVTASYTPTYTVTVNSSENGKVTANPTEGVEGTVITLTVEPTEGYELDQLTVKDASDGDVTVEAGYTFKMPASNVTVTATFKAVDGPTYTIEIDENIEKGTVVSDKAEAKKDDPVTLTITPAEGYELDTLTVGGTDVAAQVQEGKYTFNMGEANVEVTATFKAINYTITVGTFTGGKVTAPETATIGETVTLVPEHDAGYEFKSLKVTRNDTGAEVTVTDKTFVMPAANVTVTATFEKLPVTSASISWGSMSFVYDDTIAEGATKETGWTCADGANLVTVTNSGDNAIAASVEYKQETGYEKITGTFDPATQTLATGKNYAFALTLDGKPEAAISAGTKIGSVTVTIEETEIVTVVTTRAELVEAMNTGGTVQMGSNIKNNLVSHSLTSPAVLDLNGYTYTNIWYASGTQALKFNSEITIKDSLGNGGIACEDGCLYALYLGSTSSDVTVYGGTYSSNKWAAQVYKGTLTIHDGTFNGGESALIVGGSSDGATVKIYGGTFTGAINKQSGPVTIEIYGGTFSVDPSAYVDTEHYNVTNENGVYTVTVK